MTKADVVHPAIAGDAPWQRATCEYVDRLRAHYGDRLVAVVLYGSRARGDAAQESDVDLLVVLRGEFERPNEERATSELRADIENKYQEYALLCPVIAPEAEYRHRMLPFLMNIRREGLELWPLAPKTVSEEQEAYGRSQREEVLAILAKSKEALRQAQEALKLEMFDLAVVRSYYSMFHAVTALLLSEGLAFSRHSGVISAFRQQWVNPGRFPAELGAVLQPAFDLRNKADYAYNESITEVQGRDLVHSTTGFVAETERLLSSSS